MNNEISVYDSKAYKRSRMAYRMECTFEYFVAILMGDAFLAKLLTDMGFSDAETGIISSLITLAFLFQLVSIFVVRKITNTKLFAIIFHTASQIVFMSLYLLPFLGFADEIRDKIDDFPTLGIPTTIALMGLPCIPFCSYRAIFSSQSSRSVGASFDIP